MKDMHEVSARQSLSALVDGETDAQSAAALSDLWRDDAEARACWHRYQLIGDVMRSEELAGRGADAAFLGRLRTALQQEPVVLAPAARSAVTLPRRRAVRRWAPPAAVAAGFLAVAGALTVMRTEAPPAAAPQLAAAPAIEPVRAVAASAAAELPSAAAPAQVAHAEQPEPVERGSGRLVRDARLDRYLAAHQQFGGSSALGVPSGFMRSATYEGPAAAAGSR